MNKTMVFLFLACVPVCLFPLTAVAQNCPNPVTIACGDTPSGSNQNGNDGHDNYGCTEFPWDSTGPEIYCQLTITEEESLWINLEPTSAWDPALIILPESGGDCGTVPILCVDDVGVGEGPEFTSVTLPAGTYYIVVDGDGYGTYNLTMICEDCTDADGDTYPGLDESTCPALGNDCCDTGDEVSLGCTAGNAADIHPGAKEICGDGIDNNCSGHDDPCPNCGADGSIACADTGTIDTTGGASNWSDYWYGLGANYGTDWSGPEHIFSYTPTSDAGVVFTIDSTVALDVFALSDYGDPAVCNPNSCLAMGGTGLGYFPENGPAVFYAETGETYFISVDGNEGAAGSFDYDMECRTEFCVSDADIACKDSASGDTTGKDNNVSVYKGWSWEFQAPEYVYVLKTDLDADVVINLVMETGIDLALFAIEDTGDGCSPGDVLASSDIDNVSWEDWTEYVSFSTIGGVDYYVVVDGWYASNYGTFDLDVTCSVECGEGFDDCGFGFCSDVSSDPAHCGGCNKACAAGEVCSQGTCQGACGDGETDCNGSCVNLSTNPQNCGACGNVCDLQNVQQNGCVGSSCSVVSCDAGFADCDAAAANGCETALGTTDNCGACGDACAAGEACLQGTCQGTCGTGETDCSGSCVNLNTDLQNCGACGNACAAGQGCLNGTCCADADSDDHYDQGCGGDDCNDTVAAIHPGAEEICNDVDDDCDGTTDEGDVCKRDEGCGCAATDGTPASGLFLLLLAIGLVRFRRSQ